MGHWVLADPLTDMLISRLDRKSVFQRRAEGGRGQQLVAANVDTLLIGTSCNADFNLARLERYLIMANQAGSNPVIVLTKADTAEDAGMFQAQAEALQRDLPVIALNGRSADAVSLLRPWCGVGQTVALVGSSGVGKSTLVNTMTGPESDTKQKTGTIREYDAQGRHTTTARSLHAISGGGWVIDTPGIRTLYLSDVTDGIATLFAEITDWRRFADFAIVYMPMNRGARFRHLSQAVPCSPIAWNPGGTCLQKTATTTGRKRTTWQQDRSQEEILKVLGICADAHRR